MPDTKETARDWTPRRSADGVYYCSPACGRGTMAKPTVMRTPTTYARTIEILRKNVGWMGAGDLRHAAKEKERAYKQSRHLLLPAYRTIRFENVRTIRALRKLAREKESG